MTTIPVIPPLTLPLTLPPTLSSATSASMPSDVPIALADTLSLLPQHLISVPYLNPAPVRHVYKYLQIFSACCVSFAHGAKDSANAGGCARRARWGASTGCFWGSARPKPSGPAICGPCDHTPTLSHSCLNAAGPYSAIWYVYNNMTMPTNGVTNCPTWILALAALGIVVGLDTYGYK